MRKGTIISLLDKNGSVVVEYKYDPWGNHAISDANGNDLASGVGVLNPFRYRSYYYDEETDLYYLQTRYYDPELGRFLSQDDVSYLAPDTVNGLNLYAYCSNNPVMKVDPTGTFVISAIILALLAGGIATGIVGAVYGGMTAAANGQDVGFGILIGFASGFLMGVTATGGALLIGVGTVGAVILGLAVAFAGGFFAGGGGELLNQYVNQQELDLGAAALAGLEWGIINTVSALTGLPIKPTDGFWVNFVYSSWSSYMYGAIGLLFDILRGRESRRQQESSKNIKKHLIGVA